MYQGKNYNSALSVKDIAKEVRAYAKRNHPNWKFSITTESHGFSASIEIAAMEGCAIYDMAKIKHELDKMKTALGVDDRTVERLEALYRRAGEPLEGIQMHSIGESDRKYLDSFAYPVLKDVYDYLMSFNYDNSDAMTDYFDVNFYHSFNIGKWDKPYKVSLQC